MKFTTSPEQFKLFESECRKWIARLGLVGWEIKFLYQEKNHDNYLASSSILLAWRHVIVSFYKEYESDNDIDYTTEDEIRRTARHEVFEILLGRLGLAAESRYLTYDVIEEARHEVIVTLENVFDEMDLKYKPEMWAGIRVEKPPVSESPVNERMTIFEAPNIRTCPRCGCGGVAPETGLGIICMGSKDDAGFLPVIVKCPSCGIEGPEIGIKYFNRTDEVWRAFLKKYPPEEDKA